MLYLVYSQGVGTYAGTQRMIFRVVIVTINTGLWTALVALVDLIMLAADPKDLRFTILEFPICSLYFSTLLANLNSRSYVRNGRGRGESLWNELNTSHLGRAISGNPGRDTSFHLGPLPTRQGAEDVSRNRPCTWVAADSAVCRQSLSRRRRT